MTEKTELGKKKQLALVKDIEVKGGAIVPFLVRPVQLRYLNLPFPFNVRRPYLVLRSVNSNDDDKKPKDGYAEEVVITKAYDIDNGGNYISIVQNNQKSVTVYVKEGEGKKAMEELIALFGNKRGIRNNDKGIILTYKGVPHTTSNGYSVHGVNLASVNEVLNTQNVKDNAIL